MPRVTYGFLEMLLALLLLHAGKTCADFVVFCSLETYMFPFIADSHFGCRMLAEAAIKASAVFNVPENAEKLLQAQQFGIWPLHPSLCQCGIRYLGPGTQRQPKNFFLESSSGVLTNLSASSALTMGSVVDATVKLLCLRFIVPVGICTCSFLAFGQHQPKKVH